MIPLITRIQRHLLFRGLLLLALGLVPGLSAGAQPGEESPGVAAAATRAAAKEPWMRMDYGPFLTASIEAPAPEKNIAYKGIAVNLGAVYGGDHNEAIVFDTDLLRYSAGWSGSFVALKGVVYDGSHGTYPAINGTQLFGNPVLPGWGKAGQFSDPREQPYGPLPHDWAHYKGLYLHGQQVIFSYEVNGIDVLELPGLDRRENEVAFTRTINIGPSAQDQVVQVAFDAAKKARLFLAGTLEPAEESSPAIDALAVLSAEPASAADAPVLAAALLGFSKDARWLPTREGHLRLLLPARQSAARFKILLWSGRRSSLPAFAQLTAAALPPVSLEPLTHGGNPRWPEKLVTHGVLGANTGPYAIDTLTSPEQNPWNSWMRFGGMDFFADGKRAALSTWSGDVWLVTGVDGSLESLTWQRIATGLFQPLGLKIVQDRIYVLGRDQITLLQDLDGDGETDLYQNFNNDCMVSEHFHEFATDLKTDAAGNFYYMKCACHGQEAMHAHNGTLLKLPPDGSKLEVVARGFRAVNGMGIGPAGELTCVDNQGHWMPGNRINWVKPGGWYGYQWAWNPEHRTNYDEPLCWVHNFVDRSGGTHVWVPPTDQWGPLAGNLLTLSYGMGRMFLVLKEEVNGTPQGGVTQFPLEFETGIMRGTFHPLNHQLYACGLFGWAGNKTKAGGFYRVRYTGQPLNMPAALNIASDGVVLGFTDPLDPQSATDPGNFDVTCWNYKWTEQYGSPDFKLNGQEGRDTLPVASVAVSADRKSVFLKVPGIRPVMQMHIVMNLKAANAAPIKNYVHHTIHKLGSRTGLEMLGANSLGRDRQESLSLAQEAPGLIQTFTAKNDPAQTDRRRVRLPALFVAEGESPSPLLSPGAFKATWEGFLRLNLNEEVRFALSGTGAAVLRINGAVVLDQNGPALNPALSRPAPLHSGLNRFEIVYQRPPAGAAELRVLWKGASFPQEPLPPTVFVHEGADPALRERELAREGRALFAARRCASCHLPERPWPATAMPELAADAPALDGLGHRLTEPWLVRWLANPASIRTHATMPSLVNPATAPAEARDLAAFLVSLKETGTSAAAWQPPGPDSIQEGEKLFAALGCIACHLPPGGAPLPQEPRSALDEVKAKWQPAALQEFLRAPDRHYKWSRMPGFKLSAKEASVLTAFLLPQGEEAAPATGEPRGNPLRGRDLIVSLGCLKCHNLKDTADRSKAPGLAAVLTADWQHGCMAADTPHGSAPDFHLSAAERDALRQFARSAPLTFLEHDTPEEFATRQLAALRCNACHSRDLEPDLWSALPVPPATAGSADDDEIGARGGSVHIGRPPLTYSGEKLQAAWMERFISGTLPYKPRSELQGRMPAFPAYAHGLAAGLAQQHGFSADPLPTPAPDPQLAEIGKRLTTIGDGFSCVQCHDVADQKALAGKDTASVNFAYVVDRLRPSYYWRFVQDPMRLVPGTMMPKFIGDDGKTQLKTVFDGDPQRQFEAIWSYFLSLKSLQSP